MFYLGPLYDGYNENRKFAYLFWQSLRQPVYLSLQAASMFQPAQHYSFGTRRHWTEVTSLEIEDVKEAMKVARLAFLEDGGLHLSPHCTESDMRAALGKLSLMGGYQPMRLTDTEQVIQAVRGAVKHGDLIFVPKRDDLHACVKAIQEDRQKRPAPVARQQDQSPYATVQQMMGKPPRVPSGLNTPLSDAQPFDYQPEDLSDDVTDLAARGVSEAEEAECDAMYEARMTYCSALSKMYGGDARTYLACKDQAFADYQACRGYL